jgi:tetratricopeptide (TPR) repeat protein
MVPMSGGCWRPGVQVRARVLHLAAIALVGLISPLTSFAQQTGGEERPEMSVAPEFPLYETVLGPWARTVTTDVPAAQAYFDQGLQMIYAFTLPAAVASFQEAERQDPSCAMCYFGEAWARGPYLNGGMQTSSAPLAFAAIQKAVDLAEESATPVERGMINAMALRYTEEEDASRRPALDSAYARAMGELYRAYPNDLDVGEMYAESLMLLDPNRGAYRLDDPSVQAIHAVLEDVLSKDITHPGACHLYIHATEATPAAGNARACADLLGQEIPGSSHINHMPSHTYNRIGLWNEAVRANIEAWHSDQRAAWDEGVSYAATHNLHMLLFAASMAGQGGVALEAAHEYAKETPGGVFYEALVLLRFGWFDEILALDEVPERPIEKGLYEFAKGYAYLRTGEADMARLYLERVKTAAADTPEDVRIRGRHSAAQILGIVGGILEGEILRNEGDLDGAIRVFQAAAELQDGLTYDEPEPLNFAARHWLGAALLEAGRPEEAEQVYRESLLRHPNNGWSIFGLEQALRAQGRDAEADEAHAWYQQVWSESDTLIRSSRF